MFEVKVDDRTIHITGTEAAQSPCTNLVLKGDRMQELGAYVNIHDAILNAKAGARNRRTVCRHCLAAASRI
jgi:hypothetical protein